MTNVIELKKPKWRPVHKSIANLGLDDNGAEFYPFEGEGVSLSNSMATTMRNSVANDNAQPHSIVEWEGNEVCVFSVEKRETKDH
jgi:hypothetical protein